jgi:hypothetical protein
MAARQDRCWRRPAGAAFRARKERTSHRAASAARSSRERFRGRTSSSCISVPKDVCARPRISLQCCPPGPARHAQRARRRTARAAGAGARLRRRRRGRGPTASAVRSSAPGHPVLDSRPRSRRPLPAPRGARGAQSAAARARPSRLSGGGEGERRWGRGGARACESRLLCSSASAKRRARSAGPPGTSHARSVPAKRSCSPSLLPSTPLPPEAGPPAPVPPRSGRAMYPRPGAPARRLGRCTRAA